LVSHPRPSQILTDVPLANMTSWLIGGPAEYFSQPESLEEITKAVDWAQELQLPVTVLGGGTNVLVSDQGIKGLVLSMRKLKGTTLIENSKRFQFEALAGTTKSQLLKLFLSKKLAPALFLAGLPGDVGGGVVMNAGVGENLSPREFTEIVDWVDVLRDGKIIRFLKKDLKWTYRHCEGWRPGIIVKVGFSWPLEPDENMVSKVKAANLIRLEKQPLEWPSCGSVFVNPEGKKSGALIEECGLKGFQIGDAQVSTKHANFIINLGKASAKDTQSVIEHVQKTVLEKKSVLLKTEVVFLR
jgi:UDP-N-acetylmuramate dehydrogenase